jgi:transglutaminase-like putative cysteine protease
MTITLACFVALAGCGPSPSAAPPVAKADTPATKVAGTDSSEMVSAPQPKTRQFTFHYKFRVKDLKPMGDLKSDLVRVWLPCASGTDCQQVMRLDATTPTGLSEHKESRYGNPLLYFETAIPVTGEFTVDIPYQVMRHEVLKARLPGGRGDTKLDDMLRSQFLAADKMVPTTGKPLEMLDAVTLHKEPLALARQLYDVVDEHVVYKKEGTGWGRGDTNWVCDSGYGNCTDFHSLFISLARSQGLPSRFEIGFSIPKDKTEGPIAGYHCWAWFYLDERSWVPVDISEADKHPELKEYYFGNLTADRVTFSVGRDLELVPQSDNGPLNFFIYPHIEVGGKVLPKENVELQFSFADR